MLTKLVIKTQDNDFSQTIFNIQNNIIYNSNLNNPLLTPT